MTVFLAHLQYNTQTLPKTRSPYTKRDQYHSSNLRIRSLQRLIQILHLPTLRKQEASPNRNKRNLPIERQANPIKPDPDTQTAPRRISKRVASLPERVRLHLTAIIRVVVAERNEQWSCDDRTVTQAGQVSGRDFETGDVVGEVAGELVGVEEHSCSVRAGGVEAVEEQASGRCGG